MCADSAEDLGVDIGQHITLNDTAYADLNEYNLVSKYFIVDESLHEYIPYSITPEKFNLFIERMNIAYEAMLELVGSEPCFGSKIIIKHGGEENHGYQWTYIGSQYIYWNKRYIENILYNISSNIDNWWYAGTLHELGHIFDDCGDWNYDSEGSATYKAWMVMMKCNTTINYNNEVYDRNEFIDYIETQTNEKVGTVFNPILDKYGFEYGWDILQNVYKSYFDEYFPRKFYKNITSSNNEQCLLVDFIDRCSYYFGNDIKTLWSKSTQQSNEEALNNVEIDTENIKVVLYPKKATVGTELRFSVYNVDEQTISAVLLQRGSDWYNEHTNQLIELHPGNNYNIKLGYIVDYESAGQGFIIHVKGTFSNWISTAKVAKIDNYSINLSNVNVNVGDSVKLKFSYQWQYSSDGFNWIDIPSATSDTYTVSDEYLQRFLRCKITDSQGNVFISKHTNEVSLFSADILESSIGAHPRISFQFAQKNDILKNSNIHVNIYVNNSKVDSFDVDKTNQLLGWIESDYLLQNEDKGKEIYAELFFTSNTGYKGKVITPINIIN